MSRAAMSYWLLNLCTMTNGLPKHWSLLLIWFLITNNNTLVHLCLQLRGCQSLCTLGLGFLLYLLYVPGSQATTPHILSIPWMCSLLLPLLPWLNLSSLFLSLRLLLLSSQTSDLQLSLLDGFRAIFINLPVISLLHLYLHAHSAYWSGLSMLDLILSYSV